MKNKPAYAIESVDNALQLAVWLQAEGLIGPAEAAERLGSPPLPLYCSYDATRCLT
jgi:hypothetical protein